ncbi:MAG: DNA repair protein RadA, partial [Sandaracinaceae bacterium]|nr:DNA repair protein RadA [Sandaracinaceae bacterium]
MGALRELELHVCARCGHSSAHRWRRCPKCLAFASEHAPPARGGLALLEAETSEPGAIAPPRPTPLASIATDAITRRSTGLS